MKQFRIVSLSAVALAVASLGSAAPETYKVDTVHSSIVYKIKHMNVANHYGRFNDFTGTITIDEAAPETGSINFEIKADSVDSGNQKRDEHIKGPDYFNTKQFPLITFKSTGMKKAGEKLLEVTGDLTFHGVTKPITAKLEPTGKGKGRTGEIAGAEATFTIKRSDFGMNYMPQALSDEVSVIVAIEAVKQGAEAPKQ